MHRPNHAMVNAADSLMQEYGDAMSEAVFNTRPASAKSNPEEGMSNTMKLVLGGAAVAAAVYVFRRQGASLPF